MSDAIAIAYNLLARLAENGEAVTQLKLQKLLYYVQGWALGLEGKPRFDDALEAWAYGPVVYALRQEYGSHGRDPVPLPEPLPALSDDPLLDAVLEVYATCEAEELIALTHLEQPWRETYKPFHSRMVIPTALMAEYFGNGEAMEYAIHGRFVDAYRALRHGVVEWRPPYRLDQSDIAALEREFAH